MRAAQSVIDDGCLLINAGLHGGGDCAAAWCSNVLKVACRLVCLSDVAHRPLNARFAGPLPVTDRETTLSDGAPLLLLGQASVDALNDRLIAVASQPVTLSRFRPNILVIGIPAHDDKEWSEIVIGNASIGVGYGRPTTALASQRCHSCTES